MAKIIIGVPCMEQVSASFCKSLAMLQKTGHEIAFDFAINSLVYDSRNRIAARACEAGEADYVMWFDSDMVFEPDTLLKLLKADKDIVSGLYWRRSPPFTLVAFDKCDLETGDWTQQEEPEELTTCEAVGFGCVLIKVEVLYDVFNRFRTWFQPMKGFGEDLAFCWRARQLGYEIWLDPSVRCGHMGHMVVTGEYAKAFRKQEATRKNESSSN